jgi:hypothetical protein
MNKDKDDDNDFDLELDLEPDLEIEIEDDAPDADKGKPAAGDKDLVLDETQPSDEELKGYSEKVQERIKKLSFNAHAERRAKEALERQLDESVNVTRRAIDENNQLKDRIHQGEGHLKATNADRLESKIESQRQAYKTAYEEADADKIADAQQELTALQVQLEQTKQWQPQPLPRAPQPEAPQAAPVADPRAEQWRTKNAWFGKDVVMTAAALGVHQKLVNEKKLSPESDAYYTAIDTEMRKRFSDEMGAPSETPEPLENSEAAASVVAPARRGGKRAKRKVVKLSASQVEMARRLRVTPEAYAEEILKIGQS